MPIQGHMLKHNGISLLGGDRESTSTENCGPQFSYMGTICAEVPNPGSWTKGDLQTARTSGCVDDKEVFVPFSQEENIMFQTYMIEEV